MEELLHQMSAKIVLFSVLLLMSYGVIAVIIHKSLKSKVTSLSTRNDIIKLVSVAAWSVIFMKIF